MKEYQWPEDRDGNDWFERPPFTVHFRATGYSKCSNGRPILHTLGLLVIVSVLMAAPILHTLGLLAPNIVSRKYPLLVNGLS